MKNINNCNDPLNIQWTCLLSFQSYAIMTNSSSLKLSVSVIIDDMEPVVAYLHWANVGDMKNLTIASIPQIYNEHAHLLCSFTP